MINFIPLILKKNRQPPRTDLELDEDVKNEGDKLNNLEEHKRPPVTV